MKTIDLLLGSSEGRISNLIDSLVRDACGTHAVVRSTRARRVDEFSQQGRHENFDLIILFPDRLLPDPRRPASRGTLVEAASAIRTIKGERQTPILAVGVSAQYEPELSEAGADRVLELPFNCGVIKATVRQLLDLPEAVEQPAAGHGVASWVNGLTGNN